jgi:hypothetical protein
MDFARTLTPEVTKSDSYIAGDCTIALWKAQGEE